MRNMQRETGGLTSGEISENNRLPTYCVERIVGQGQMNYNTTIRY